MKQFIFFALILSVVGALAYATMSGSWSLNSKGAGPDEGDREAQIIERFELEGFGDDGERAWRLQGDRAHVKDGGDVFIERDVELNLAGGTDIFADKVYWQNTRSRFLTNRPVKIEHEGIGIEGRGALGRLERQFVQINQDIRMIINSGTIVTSRGPMKIYRDENRVVLYRDVWILDEQGSVSADRMDGFFDPEARKIIAIVAKGDVRISRGEDVTYSEVAIYDNRTGSVRLEGSPQIDIRNIDKVKQDASDPSRPEPSGVRKEIDMKLGLAI